MRRWRLVLQLSKRAKAESATSAAGKSPRADRDGATLEEGLLESIREEDHGDIDETGGHEMVKVGRPPFGSSSRDLDSSEPQNTSNLEPQADSSKPRSNVVEDA